MKPNGEKAAVGCMDCGYLGGWVNDVYDSEGEWAGSEWLECSCQRPACPNCHSDSRPERACLGYDVDSDRKFYCGHNWHNVTPRYGRPTEEATDV